MWASLLLVALAYLGTVLIGELVRVQVPEQVHRLFLERLTLLVNDRHISRYLVSHLTSL